VLDPQQLPDPLGVGHVPVGVHLGRHHEPAHPVGAERLGGEIGGQRRVDPAREPDDGPVGTGVRDHVGHEVGDVLAVGLEFGLREREFDGQLLGQRQNLRVAHTLGWSGSD